MESTIKPYEIQYCNTNWIGITWHKLATWAVRMCGGQNWSRYLQWKTIDHFGLLTLLLESPRVCTGMTFKELKLYTIVDDFEIKLENLSFDIVLWVTSPFFRTSLKNYFLRISFENIPKQNLIFFQYLI